MISPSTNKFLSRLSVFLLVLMCGVIFFTISPATAQELGVPELAPINPEFLQFIQNVKDRGVQNMTADGHALGYIPSPVDLSHLTGLPAFQFQMISFPASYDLRTTGKLTPVKDQGNCGSCWAFATYGSLESNLLTAETWDFSENNLKNTHGFDVGHCDGGNENMSTAYLSRWSGPIKETDDPYNPSSDVSPSGLTTQKHIQEVLIIPDRASSTDNENIKQAVMTYGALYTTMYYSSSYYNSTNKTYYYNGTSNSNHGVAIVGWDDNFDKNKFSTVPPGNGAFIVRNSWGTSWGESGYFYISYYDTNIGKSNHVFNGAEPTTNYSRVYQYDPLGWVGSAGYGNDTAWFANIFTAVANEFITAVSFYAASPNSPYEIYIYTNVSSGPNSGSLAGSTTGTIALAGYHTITLPSQIYITAGQKFSIVVKLTTPGYNYPVPLEYPYPGYSSQATANAGESYISSNGSSWTDITTYFSNTNVCLKAFTSLNVQPYTLTVTKTGIGTGTVSASGCTLSWNGNTGTCTANSGTQIALTATPDSGSTFAGWSNGTGSAASCTGTGNCTFTITENSSITATFTAIQAVRLLSPNGGEVIPSGGSYQIQWQAPSTADHYTLKLSMDNGMTWSTIATNVTGNSYDWTVPKPLNNKRKCYIKVIAFNASNVKIGADRSDAPFTIEVVKLNTPNGGESLTSGDSYEIKWSTNATKNPVSKVILQYTLDGGLTWKQITTFTGGNNPGIYTWTIPTVVSTKTKCKVKVVLKDSAGNVVGSDLSDGFFTINPL
jgi:C1A family cysteine protease